MVTAFFAKYRHLFHETPALLEIPPLSGRHLQEAVSSMRTRASTGKLGWTVAELRSLPLLAWEEYAAWCNLCEKTAFPLPLKEAWIALIPKDDPSESHTCIGGPLEVRPIAVEPLLLRIWSSA
eukprot:6470131-Amphidinium_carterae.1